MVSSRNSVGRAAGGHLPLRPLVRCDALGAEVRAICRGWSVAQTLTLLQMQSAAVCSPTWTTSSRRPQCTAARGCSLTMADRALLVCVYPQPVVRARRDDEAQRAAMHCGVGLLESDQRQAKSVCSTQQWCECPVGDDEQEEAAMYRGTGLLDSYQRQGQSDMTEHALCLSLHTQSRLGCAPQGRRGAEGSNVPGGRPAGELPATGAVHRRRVAGAGGEHRHRARGVSGTQTRMAYSEAPEGPAGPSTAARSSWRQMLTSRPRWPLKGFVLYSLGEGQPLDNSDRPVSRQC